MNIIRSNELFCPWCKKAMVKILGDDVDGYDAACTNKECVVQPCMMRAWRTEEQVIEAWGKISK